MTDLYNRERTYLRATKRLEQERPPEEDAYPQAFSEIVTYLVETTRSNEGPAVFRLADIIHLYAQRLEQLSVDAPAVNSTRLKEKLLSEIPELELHKQGRDILLAFQALFCQKPLTIIVKLLSLAKQLTSCEDVCWTTSPHLMEPSMRGASSRPFHSLFFSLWACLNTERTSNLN